MWIRELYGAGYGNRTRDRGLGSDCFSIKLILHGLYYSKGLWKIQPQFVVEFVPSQIFSADSNAFFMSRLQRILVFLRLKIKKGTCKCTFLFWVARQGLVYISFCFTE